MSMSNRYRWGRDATILALDLFRRRGSVGPLDPEVIAATRLLGVGSSSFAMKLRNFAHLAGQPGLGNASRLDHEIWREFSGNTDQLGREAQRIRGRRS